MGCDIHTYVEKKTNDGWVAIRGKNPWIAKYQEWADKENKDLDRKRYLLNKVKEMEEKTPNVLQGWIYDGRNYNLFAILANVRNRHDIKPIDNPRGLPVDLSEEVKEADIYWGCDGHSHSYYTFKELLSFDWENNYVENEAYVDEETYKKFKETGDPYPCSQGVGGGSVEKVLNSEMERIIKNKYPWEQDKHFYTAIRWTDNYKDIAIGLLDNINEFVQKNNIKDTENYRMVFWFDN